MADPGVQVGPSGVPRISIYPPLAVGAGDYGAFDPLDSQTASPNTNGGGYEAFDPLDVKATPLPAAPPTQLPKQPKEQTSPLQRIAIDFNNQGQAAAQGTTPIIAAQEPFLIGPALQDEEGNVGYADRNGQFVQADRAKHVVLTDPNDNTPKVYLRNELTNEGQLASAGRLIGTGMAAGNIELSGPVEAAARAAQAAQRVGVQVPRAIMSPSKSVQFLGQNVAEMPGGAPLGSAVTESRNALSGAVQRGSEMTGGAVNPMRAGEGFQTAVKGATTTPVEGATRSASFLSRAVAGTEDAYGAVEDVVDANATAPLNSTAATVADIDARRAAAGLGASNAANTVLEAATRPGGLTFAGIKDLRTRVGEMLDTGVLPEGMSNAELKRIYGALTQDLGNAARVTGGTAGAAAFQKANAMAKMLADWKDRLRSILGNSRSGEDVYGAIVQMASEKGGDIRNLSVARASIPAQGWANIAATAISRLGRLPNGDWSPARFISDYAKLSDRGKAILFGGVGHSDLIGFLNDIAEVSNKFIEAGKLGNFSHTSGHVTGPLALLAAGEGAARGSWVEPAVAIAALVGNNVMARILSMPATASSFARWSRVYSRLAQNPGPATVAAFNRASGQIANTVRSQLGVNFNPGELLRTIQSPVGGRANDTEQQVPRRPAQ